jgi:hypothetical protein
LLKVDVEGDELNVLLGIDAAHWPMIRQVVVEVHDVDGRLHDVCRLLRGVGYTSVVSEQQRTVCSAGGYVAVIPAAAQLHYVWATRAPPSASVP